MIIINRGSWHVRFYIWSHNKEPSNLCVYIRGMLSALLMLLVMLASAGIALLLLAAPIIYLLNLAGVPSLPDVTGLFFVIGMTAWGGLLIILSRMAALKYASHGSILFEPIIPQNNNPKYASFTDCLYEWRHAAHDKICPTIIIVDDE